jgi:hypothetical protein
MPMAKVMKAEGSATTSDYACSLCCVLSFTIAQATSCVSKTVMHVMHNATNLQFVLLITLWHQRVAKPSLSMGMPVGHHGYNMCEHSRLGQHILSTEINTEGWSMELKIFCSVLLDSAAFLTQL